jgi:hypothetical protein
MLLAQRAIRDRLKAELEKSDAEPAEEQLKSQKTESKSWFKPRF